MKREKKKQLITIALVILLLILAIVFFISVLRIRMIKKSVEFSDRRGLANSLSENESTDTDEIIPDDIAQKYKEELQLEPNSVSNSAEVDAVIQAIIEHSETSTEVSLFSNDVILTFCTPDMERYITETDLSDITSIDELKDDILSYIDTAEKKERSVTLKASFKDMKWFVDDSQYKTVEYVDAMTGGFVSGYISYSNSILDGLKEK